ncbi:IS1380 family transposase [Arthrobacter echini]|uniref:IS1380 family transposase n=1 Tax=Arthrobacter echini TaxID=1529066 RepID=A0A4S5DYG9_9MICC|nr:IS1380 family transposase [Arthrobacter echini]THJ64024.1 IS1380 family transposase [Arthrobacter echini]
MSNTTNLYPSVRVDSAGAGVMSQAGGLILTDTIRVSGLGTGFSDALEPWRKPFAVHDPGKILTDLALSLATGGDCLADVDRLRSQPQVYGPVASDPTVSRLITTLSTMAPKKALAAINTVRATARAQVWMLAGEHSPLHGISRDAPLVVDLDATVVTSHSEKEHACPTWKKSFGFHPLAAFLDHGADGTGEPLAVLLRPGNAGSNTAKDHIQVTKDALQQLPKGFRSGRKVLIRTDSAGGTHEFLDWLTHPRRNLSYSVGFPIHGAVEAVLPLVPKDAWNRAYNSDGVERDGAWVADITGMLDLTSWPAGMRVIVRKEVPHVGAQLRITDVDGMRYTALATNQEHGQLADLEVRHRLRARCEDRIRNAKDTGLANLPLHGFAGNTLWCHLVMLAAELMAWTQMLSLHTTRARRWEPKKLRARLFEIAGRVSFHARRFTVHLAATAPETPLLLTALQRLNALAPP